MNLLLLSKLIGAGLATISLAGSGVGIGIVFAGFLSALSRNPKDEKKIINIYVIRFCINWSNSFIWTYDGFFNFIRFLRIINNL